MNSSEMNIKRTCIKVFLKITDCFEKVLTETFVRKIVLAGIQNDSCPGLYLPALPPSHCYSFLNSKDLQYDIRFSLFHTYLFFHLLTLKHRSNLTEIFKLLNAA